MNRLEVLLEEIEDLRKQLQDLINRKYSLDTKLMEVSEALDKKLNEYDELKKQTME